jgi:ssDNA thymidine ADP-ribosyltransferase, DarT
MTLAEFQNIALIDNLPSVLEHGILSHAEAKKITHLSVALQAVQDKRDAKRVPGGLPLHEYANVYFHARNPMMSLRRNEAHRDFESAWRSDHRSECSKQIRAVPGPESLAVSEFRVRVRPQLETSRRSNRRVAPCKR